MSVIYTGGLYALWIWAAPLLQLDRWGPQEGSPGWLCSLPTIFLSQFCSLLLTLPSWSLCCCFTIHPRRYCLQGFSPCWTACTPRLSFDISVKASMTPQVLHSSWLQNLHCLDVTKVFCLHKLFRGPLKPWLSARYGKWVFSIFGSTGHPPILLFSSIEIKFSFLHPWALDRWDSLAEY